MADPRGVARRVAVDPHAVAIVPGSWDAKVGADLLTIRRMSFATVAALRDEVSDGLRQVALVIDADGRRLASLVWCVQTDADGAWLVIDALAGRSRPGLSLALQVETWARAKAARMGLEGVRIWTDRPGMARLLRRWRTRFVIEATAAGGAGGGADGQ